MGHLRLFIAVLAVIIICLAWMLAFIVLTKTRKTNNSIAGKFLELAKSANTEEDLVRLRTELRNWANTCLLRFEHSTAIAIDSFMEGKIAGIHAAKK